MQSPPENPAFTEPPRTGPKSSQKFPVAGPVGLRAGWRLLIFFAIFGLLFVASVFLRFGGPRGVQNAYRNLGQTAHTPLFMGKSSAIAFLVVCLSTWIMSRIERRKFSDYGLPFGGVLKKDFWFGCALGFLGIGGTLLAIFLLHGCRITGLALHGTQILSSSLAWVLAFLFVGLSEEFLFRGYMQYTLACGIGFWPAAFVLSGLFGLGHVLNSRENIVGSISVVMFGLLLCLFLGRSGNLWCAVGFHLGYDWGQTFFFGVPDSGIVPYHNLLNSTLSGPKWLTGGIVGPEASVLTPIALLIVAAIFSRFYSENRYRVGISQWPKKVQ